MWVATGDPDSRTNADLYNKIAVKMRMLTTGSHLSAAAVLAARRGSGSYLAGPGAALRAAGAAANTQGQIAGLGAPGPPGHVTEPKMGRIMDEFCRLNDVERNFLCFIAPDGERAFADQTTVEGTAHQGRRLTCWGSR